MKTARKHQYILKQAQDKKSLIQYLGSSECLKPAQTPSNDIMFTPPTQPVRC